MSEIITSDRVRADFGSPKTRWKLSVVPPRPALAALGLAALAAGLAWQWQWLVAVGVAPILVSVAPCALMCALGLCMTRAKGRTCHAETPQSPELPHGGAMLLPPRHDHD
jgi:hypothetical protein